MPYVSTCDDCGTRDDAPAIVGEFTEEWINGTVEGCRLGELGVDPTRLVPTLP